MFYLEFCVCVHARGQVSASKGILNLWEANRAVTGEEMALLVSTGGAALAGLCWVPCLSQQQSRGSPCKCKLLSPMLQQGTFSAYWST